MSNLSKKVQNLFLEQFTAFESATFEFCPGINVLIGANATGKSHVGKVFKKKLTWLTSRVLVCGNDKRTLPNVTVSSLPRN
jgi:predicted ATP-binding protein involved in virulence